MKPPTGLRARRKAETRQEIAEAAALLFAERGVAGVTAAEIAASAGVSLRTFYRYFDTKEQAVSPVLEVGAVLWQQAIQSAAGTADAAIVAAMTAVLTPTSDDDAQALLRMRPLLRAMAEDAELRAVWQAVNHASETQVRGILAAKESGANPDRFAQRLMAAAATESIRLALEEWAESDAGATGAGSPGDLALRAFRALSPS